MDEDESERNADYLDELILISSNLTVTCAKELALN
jgi:hypothetical protein